jgi:hypothetical protein
MIQENNHASLPRTFLHGNSSLNPTISLSFLLLTGASLSPILLVNSVFGHTLFRNSLLVPSFSSIVIYTQSQHQLTHPPPTIMSYLIINRIKNLKPQPIFSKTTIHHIPQIPRIRITPPMHLKVPWPRKIRLEFLLVLIRLDDRADPQTVNIDTGEALREAGGDVFHAEFGGGVDVHGLGGGRLGQGEMGVVDVAFGVGDAVGGDGGGEDYLLDAEFAGGFDYVWELEREGVR